MSNTSHTPNLESAALSSAGLQSTAEFLPWLINGSLESEETEAVLSSLDSMSDELAFELAATGEMFWLTEQHVPTLALAEYALELPTSELSRHEIERHLEGCAACRAEMALIAADEVAEEDDFHVEAPVIDFATAARRRQDAPPSSPSNRPMWRRVALAATLAVAVAGALLVQVQSELEAPVVGLQDVAQVSLKSAADHGEETLRPSTPDPALFFDGFESGDIAGWSTISN